MDSVLVDRHVTCAASRARFQRQALLQAVAETTAGKDDLNAARQVRHYKEVCLQEWPLAGRATVPRVLYGIGLRMSLRRRTILSKKFTGARSRRPHHSHFSHDRQNRRSSFCSGRGESLVTIARFGKPLFANMHHRVHAVAGALRKLNVACPHPDVSTGWPVWWWCDRRWVRTPQMPVCWPFVDRTDLFLHLHSSLKT